MIRKGLICKGWWSCFAIGVMAAAAHAQEDGGFTVRGRVLDAGAKPVAGAMVRLLAPGFGGFEVDVKTAADAEGLFRLAAPASWTRMEANQRQELALAAVHQDRIAIVQFSRYSAPPAADVELKLPERSPSTITVLGPDNRPVAGARLKIAGLIADTIHVDPSEAALKHLAGKAKKTPIGYLMDASTVGLPPDLQTIIGTTDAKGVAAVSAVAAARIGALTVQTDEFGEQTVSHYSQRGARPPNWPQRIVLKPTGRIVGQLSSLVAGAVARREVTLISGDRTEAGGIYSMHNSVAKLVTDEEGRFEAPRMTAGTVRTVVKFDPKHRVRPDNAVSELQLQLKAGETVQLKIELKPTVRVEGRVLDAASGKPIPNVQVRAYLGMGFESAASDAEGKFSFWMPAGETAFHPDIPDEYLSPVAPSDHADPVKRQQRSITIFKVPQAEHFEAPPIRLYRQATLRGVVVDDRGRPLPGANVSGVAQIIERRTGMPKTRELSARADDRGEFAIAGLDPREPLRLRVAAGDVWKIVTIAQPGSETARIVIAPGQRFHISGQVADAEGKPVAGAVLELWQRDWRPMPPEAAPKKLDTKAPIRTDAAGRFTTPPLAPDGHYRFTIRAAGVKTVESAWLDATDPRTAKPQRLVVIRLGGLTGVVRDRARKPIADAKVALFSDETRAETVAGAEGEFKLEAPAGKPFCVIVRHPDFRVHGTYYENNPPNLDQTMTRLDESAEKLAPRTILTVEERAKLLKRVFEPFKHRVAKAASERDKVMHLQSLTGVAGDFVTEFLEQHPLQQADYNKMLLTQVAMKQTSVNPDDAEELIARLDQGAQQSMAYGMLVDALPEKARDRKLAILAEALVAARAEKSPEFRAISLGHVAKRLWALGEKDRAGALLREGEKIATGLSTSAYAGFARATFATDLALIDLPAALALMKDLKDRGEFARHHGNTAHRIAGTHPAEAVKVLDLIPPPVENEFNQRDHYAIRVCYRMAQADLKAALKLADSIVDLPSRAYALGVMAQGIAKAQPRQAADLMRLAFALLEEDAARPDPPQLTSPLTPGGVASALVLVAEQADPTLVRECLWRAVALMRPRTEDRQQVWRYVTGNSALAMVAARYDAKLAALLLPEPAQWVGRELPLASFLINPRQAVEAAEKTAAAKGPGGQDSRDLLQVITFLSTDEPGIPRLIFNTIGVWRIDVEDIDF